jgi:hypothetical protein
MVIMTGQVYTNNPVMTLITKYVSRFIFVHSAIITEDEKDWEGYIKGGYHLVHIEDLFSDEKYTRVVNWAGGHFSTV